MGKLKFLILLMIVCVNSFLVTAQNDSLKVPPNQVRNIYIGLKQNDVRKQQLIECKEIALSLNDIIVKQRDSIQKSLLRLSNLNQDISDKQNKLTDYEVKLESLKNERIPWYRHPLLYFVLGVGGGVWMMK